MTEEIHNAYQTLELPIGADLPQVQKAWREMVTVWHPDRFPNNPDLQRKAQERTKQINNAYDILKRYLIDGDIPRSRSSKQSKKQESQQRTRQQETASEDAQSSQTHEQENRQKQTTKPFKEKSPAAKIGEIIDIEDIIFGAGIGYFFGGVMVSLPFVLDWMIEAVSGWSFIDGANPWIETFPSKTLIIVPLIVTFLSRITSAMLTENERKLIGNDEDWDWLLYTFAGVFCGTIGGIIGSGMGDTGIFIGAVLGACLGYYLAFCVEKENDD